MTSTSLSDGLSRARQGRNPGGRGPSRAAKPHARPRTRALIVTLIAFVTPSVILIGLLNIYPVAYAVLQSLQNGTLIQAGDFIGFANYVAVLTDDGFWRAARFTLTFTIVGVFGSWLVGLGLALLLRTWIPGRNVFRVLLLLPWVVPTVVTAASWNWLVATPQSPFPVIFRTLGLGQPLFLADPTLAQITVMVFKVWISFPFMMMMIGAALASVDVNVYEAAKVDGAGKFQTFRLITLPLIARSTFISWILMTIFCVNDFPTIFLLTQGGPAGATRSLVVTAYLTVFADFKVGQGTAIAFILTAVLVVVSVILYRQIRRANVE